MYGETHNLRELIMDRVHVNVTKMFPETELQSLVHNAQIRTWWDYNMKALCAQLVTEFPAILKERIVVNERWPKDWWQAVKERFFPQWLVKRFPVEYNMVSIDKPIYESVCPHGATGKHPRGAHYHLRYLAGDRDVLSPTQSQSLQSLGRGTEHRADGKSCSQPWTERSFTY